MNEHAKSSLQAAIARLRAYRCPSSVYPQLPLSRRAAVLLLLFADRHGDLRVVLTLRSNSLRSHPGEVSLPGGKADREDEQPFQTARREAFEEIGLPTTHVPPPFEVEHLCELPTFLSKTQLGVRPCVAFLSTGQRKTDVDAEESLIPQLNAKEVAAIFTAPFQRFVRTTHGAEVGGRDSGIRYKGAWLPWNDSSWRMHQFFIPKPSPSKGEDNEYRVWGLTAEILVDAARVAFDTNPDFEHNESIGEEAMVEYLFQAGEFRDKLPLGHSKLS